MRHVDRYELDRQAIEAAIARLGTPTDAEGQRRLQELFARLEALGPRPPPSTLLIHDGRLGTTFVPVTVDGRRTGDAGLDDGSDDDNPFIRYAKEIGEYRP